VHFDGGASLNTSHLSNREGVDQRSLGRGILLSLSERRWLARNTPKQLDVAYVRYLQEISNESLNTEPGSS
jgi:hypothetical protein